MQPTEESQESLCKLKYITESPPERIAMSKTKAGIRERQRAMLVSYKLLDPGFSASCKGWRFLL